MNWQEKRYMSAAEYRAIIQRLDLNTASAARYLGVGTRTSHRYGRGEANIPEATVLLLRALIACNIVPDVPSWKGDRNKHW